MDKNIHVLSADMENRSPEEIAKDFTNQIAELFDKLVKDNEKKAKRN